MTVTPLPTASAATFRDLLRAHGWDADQARDTAAGMTPAAFHCAGLSGPALEALVVTAGRIGVEVVTGDDWALLSGARSRLAIFARPWTLPPELAEVAVALAQSLPESDTSADD